MGFRSLQTLVERADPRVFLSFAVFFYEPKLIVPIRLLFRLILDSLTLKSTFRSIAQMAKLLDAHGSGPCAFGCGGSRPLLRTKRINTTYHQIFFLYCYMGPQPYKARHPQHILATHLNFYYKSDRQS